MVSPWFEKISEYLVDYFNVFKNQTNDTLCVGSYGLRPGVLLFLHLLNRTVTMNLVQKTHAYDLLQYINIMIKKSDKEKNLLLVETLGLKQGPYGHKTPC